MEAAVASIGQDVFGAEPVVKTETEVETKEETKEEVKEEASEEVKEEIKARVAPQSWKKEMHEFWNGVDPAVQDYIEQRELQMKEGLEKDRGDANLGRTMRDVMSPYSEMLKSQNVDETAMVRNLMNAHYRISNADEAGRKDLFNQLAQSYGISLDGKVEQMDPALKAMQDRLSGIEGNINASHERTLQEARDRVGTEVEEFSSDPKHEFFDEVSEQIIPLINAGYTLEDAYNNAIWLNPVTRQKEIDRTAKEAADKAEIDAKQEADKARKAKATNVRGRDTGKASTEPTGTMEDTMRQVYRDIQNRSH
jgi:predicted phage tail protein